MRPYECDGLTAIREQPWLVALPETEAQVASVLRICHEHGVPIVPRGAGTGLSGGARPNADAVVLGLSKLSRILELDVDNCVARVQPGVRNLAISEAAAEHGLYYAPDPSSQIACSIGGNVAENSGGVHCLKYGLTVHNVLGARVLMADGRTHRARRATLDSPGYDLLAVLMGSEGMLGVVTEVTVALLPRPEAVVVMLAAFREVDAAGAAVASIIAARDHPGRYGDDGRTRHTGRRDFVPRRLPHGRRGYPALRARRLRGRGPGPHGSGGPHRAARRRLFRRRRERRRRPGAHVAGPQVGVSCGRAHLAGLLLHGRHHPAPPAALRAHAHRRTLAGVWPATWPTCSMPAMATCIRLSCSTPTSQVSSRRRKRWAARSWNCASPWAAPSPASMASASRSSIRCACSSTPWNSNSSSASRRPSIRPDLLNPGKAHPDAHALRELGGMHVRHGELPFEELERF